MASSLSSVAIFGATGNLGSSVIAALLATGKQKITAIVRAESKAALPASVAVIKGDMNSSEFLTQSLKGQDVVIIALGMGASPDVDKAIVTAAAVAGVKYIFPNEFVSQDSLRKHFPFGLHDRKNAIREHIEKLGMSKWIAIVNGTWYDFSLANGYYGIDVKKRRAIIYTPTTTAANVTTLAKVGKSIAALLSLDENKLQQFANRCMYVSSFKVTQTEILESVQRVTQTAPKDWEISYEDVHSAAQEGQENAKKGNVEGLLKVIYAMQFQPGAGGDYVTTNGSANKDLGLEEEDLDAVTRLAIAKT